MSDADVLAHLPVGIPVDLLVAFGDLISAALDGAMLGPGQHPGTSAEIQLPEGLDRRAAAERLRHAAAAVRGVEYVPEQRDPDEPDLTLNRMTIDERGVDLGLGGAQDTVDDHVKRLLAAFLPALDEQGATNYLEWSAEVPDTRIRDTPGTARERFVVIVCRPGGKTPHQLRRDAEAEVERLRAELAACRGFPAVTA